MTIGEIIRGVLVATPSIAAIVGARIYAGRLPNVFDYPCVLMTEITNTPAGTEPVEIAYNLTMQFSFFGDSLAILKTLADETRRALATLKNITNGNIKMTIGRTISAWRDIPYYEDENKFAGSMDIQIKYYIE